MYYIGIDVGGTNLAAGLVDDNLEIVFRKSVKTDRNASVHTLSKTLAMLTEDIFLESKVDRTAVGGIGLGVPGTANRKSGKIEYANNLPFCQGDLKLSLEKRTGKKVYFDNDANAAAWGEYLVCENKPESFIMITLGTGVGCGIIQNGKLIRGINFAAGEIGHMTIRYDGIPCNCGRKGCFELYASAEALVQQTRKMMQKNKKCKLWDLCNENIECVDGKLFFQTIRMKDKDSLEVLDQYIEYLSEGLTNIINILQPDVICIGGGISKAGDLFLPLLKEKIAGKIYSRDSEENTLLTTAKLDNDAGIIGAAMLHLCE